MSGIKLAGLSKTYGSAQALKTFDLEIKSGEWITLLGPSGCGKTTTLRLVAGFIEPTSGSITIGEQVVSDVARKVSVPIEKRRLGMVFQAYAVWPHMTVLDNVAYPLRLRNVKPAERKERALKALEQVQLDNFEKRYPHELSGGQQQRVALARALVSEPEVLLLDEPLSALDAQLRLELRSLLSKAHRETGLTVVFVTHDQDEAITLSDRVVVMSNGEVQQVGTPKEIYDNPVNEFVARFIGSGAILPVQIVNGHLVLSGLRLGPATHPKVKSVLVRPEHVTLSPDGRFAGKVAESWFRGDHELVYLATDAGEVVARHDSTPASPDVRFDIAAYAPLKG